MQQPKDRIAPRSTSATDTTTPLQTQNKTQTSNGGTTAESEPAQNNASTILSKHRASKLNLEGDPLIAIESARAKNTPTDLLKAMKVAHFTSKSGGIDHQYHKTFVDCLEKFPAPSTGPFGFISNIMTAGFGTPLNLMMNLKLPPPIDETITVADLLAKDGDYTVFETLTSEAKQIALVALQQLISDRTRRNSRINLGVGVTIFLITSVVGGLSTFGLLPVAVTITVSVGGLALTLAKIIYTRVTERRAMKISKPYRANIDRIRENTNKIAITASTATSRFDTLSQELGNKLDLSSPSVQQNPNLQSMTQPTMFQRQPTHNPQQPTMFQRQPTHNPQQPTMFQRQPTPAGNLASNALHTPRNPSNLTPTGPQQGAGSHVSNLDQHKRQPATRNSY